MGLANTIYYYANKVKSENNYSMDDAINLIDDLFDYYDSFISQCSLTISLDDIKKFLDFEWIENGFDSFVYTNDHCLIKIYNDDFNDYKSFDEWIENNDINVCKLIDRNQNQDLTEYFELPEKWKYDAGENYLIYQNKNKEMVLSHIKLENDEINELATKNKINIIHNARNDDVKVWKDLNNDLEM